MLVITRKMDEGLVIGENIRITVIEIKGHSVRLGIEAPRSIQIFREEIIKKQEGKCPVAPSVAFEDSSVAKAGTLEG